MLLSVSPVFSNFIIETVSHAGLDDDLLDSVDVEAKELGEEDKAVGSALGVGEKGMFSSRLCVDYPLNALRQ